MPRDIILSDTKMIRIQKNTFQGNEGVDIRTYWREDVDEEWKPSKKEVRLPVDDIVGKEAHHVLPDAFSRQFKRKGFDVHDPKFGSWVDAKSHRGWSYEYNSQWSEFLSEDTTPEDILEFAQQLAKEYGFDVLFSVP